MSELTAVIDHFPAHELTIRRLYANAPDFRVLCEDYEAARCALEHWGSDGSKAEDFQRLLAEIEDEIFEALQKSLNRIRRNPET